MLGQPGKLWIWTRADQDLDVAFGEVSSVFSLERLGNHCRPTAFYPRADNPIDKVDKLVRQSNRNLLAHPTMVASW